MEERLNVLPSAESVGHVKWSAVFAGVKNLTAGPAALS